MLEKSNVEAIYPLGPAQRGMLYYCVVHPDEGAYLEQLQASFAGDLRPEALRRAWELVVARHGALRSQVAWEHRDRPLQVVRRAIELPWTELDWRDVPEDEVEERLATFLSRDREEAVPLDRPPLLRVALVRRPGDRWEMVWTFHHILLDGWSMGVLLSELWTAYAAFARGAEPELPEAPSLGPWAAWLGRRDEGEDRAFWCRALAGFEEPFAVDLPGGGSRIGEARGDEARGQARRLVSGPDLDLLSAFARSQDLTLNALAQGAWALLLRRYAGRFRVAFGAVASGRPPEVPGIERLVGVFMNAVPAWVALPGSARVGEWLRGLQAAQAEARDHAHRPLEEIQEWLGLPRREPPFDTLLVFENYPADPGAARDLAGAELLAVRTRERGTFPVALYMAPRGRELHLWLDHRRDRLGDEAAERLLDVFLGLMSALAQDPDRRLSDLPLLDGAERRR
ncbi:MAG TPA: condensation domain-containing protein, partial [Thermoanaerobaculia bacterium]|nr:condensation domain-containing protein [Thermoanaerobaculia bacterium]